jgi:dienelactone hydrolase
MFRSTLIPFLLIACATPSIAQTVDLPEAIVNGESVDVELKGFTPGDRVTIEAELNDPSDGIARSRAVFAVPESGTIDLSRDAPVEGTYQGVDAAGLFWSMRSAGSDSAVPMGLSIRASVGDRIVAQDRADIAPLPTGVVMREVSEFTGARLYRPERAGRYGVIILLGGSEGGSDFGRRIGPILAARGFATLALPYYVSGWSREALPGLPRAFVNIPVDRLETVRRWIGSQDDLDSSRIGIHGVSKGGEFALIAASRMPWLRAVSAIVPSDVVWEGWGDGSADGVPSSFAWRGQPLPFVPYEGMSDAIAALSRGEFRALSVPHLEGRRRSPERVSAARIPIERFRGAVLIAGGDRDTTWPSGEMVRAIAERRAAAGRRTIALSFADAGHALAGTGWRPLDWDGRPVPAVNDARAQRQVYAAVVSFFESVLR